MLYRERRRGRAFMYGMLSLAGVTSFFIHVSFTAGIALKVCGVFLFVGGAVSLTGHLKTDVKLEKLGFPLLVTAMGTLSLLAFLGGPGSPPRYLVALLLAAFTFGLFGRYRDLQTLIALSRPINREDQNG